VGASSARNTSWKPRQRAAFFDYDQDGWIDIYLTNGDASREEPYPMARRPPTSFKNNAMAIYGRYEKSGLAGRLGTGVCVGDYDNDGG